MRMRHVPLLLGAVALTGAVCEARGRTWQHGKWSPMTRFTSSTGLATNYYLFTPKAAADGAKLPMVVWLHGGLRSNGVGGPNVVRDAFYRDEHQEAHPCFVLRPLALKGKNWVSPRGCGIGSHRMPEEPSVSIAMVVELIDKTIREHPIDERRLYVVGASMGGYGTWDLIQRYPKRFAAVMPICGGGDPSLAERIKGMAIWITHGDQDRHVPVRGSREMFDALMKARGEKPIVRDEAKRIARQSPDGRIRFCEYKGAGHNAAWDRGLTEPDLTEWFFGKSLRQPAADRDPTGR